MSTPTFRLTTIDDLPQLIEMRILMQKEVNNLSDEAIGPEYIESVRRYFEENLRDGTYVSAVAEVDKELVSTNGVVVYSKPPSVNGGTQLGYVCNVYTRPEWRGRGIAHDLMKLLVERARLKGVARLHLGATDLGKGVYERVGFKPPRFTPLELSLLSI